MTDPADCRDDDRDWEALVDAKLEGLEYEIEQEGPHAKLAAARIMAAIHAGFQDCGTDGPIIASALGVVLQHASESQLSADKMHRLVDLFWGDDQPVRADGPVREDVVDDVQAAELERLVDSLEGVQWSRVPGVSSSTASTFGAELQQAADRLRARDENEPDEPQRGFIP